MSLHDDMDPDLANFRRSFADARKEGGNGNGRGNGKVGNADGSDNGGAPDLREDAIYSDCSLHSNPGIADVRAVDWKGNVLRARRPPRAITVNFAELVGIVLAIDAAHETGKRIVYTDSQVAHRWIMGRPPKSLLQDAALIRRFIDLGRRKAKERGITVRWWSKQRNGGREIPADYGRKGNREEGKEGWVPPYRQPGWGDRW